MKTKHINKTPNTKMIKELLNLGSEKLEILSWEMLQSYYKKDRYYLKQWLMCGGREEDTEVDSFIVTGELLNEGIMILVMKMPQVQFEGEVSLFALTIEKENANTVPTIYILELTKDKKYNLYFYGYALNHEMKIQEKKHILLEENVEPTVEAFLNTIKEKRKHLKHGFHTL